MGTDQRFLELLLRKLLVVWWIGAKMIFYRLKTTSNGIWRGEEHLYEKDFICLRCFLLEAAHGKGLRRAIWLFCRSESGPVGWPGRSNENICFYDYPSPFATQRTRPLLLFSHAKECARRPNIQTGALAETPSIAGASAWGRPMAKRSKSY